MRGPRRVTPTAPTAPIAPTTAAAASAPFVTMLLLVWLVGLALYAGTLAPSLLWGDDAELQRIVVTGEPRTIGQSSSASHLLWLAVASAIVRWTVWLPLDAAGRVNLVSALAGAAALPFVAAAATVLAQPVARQPLLAGFAAAGALALSHTFWLLAGRPDVYTLQMALLAVATWSILRWRQSRRRSLVRSPQFGRPRSLAAIISPLGLLLVAGAASAAALTNHAMILASVPGLAWFAFAVPATPRRRVTIGAAVTMAAAILVLLAAAGTPLGELVRTLRGFRPVVPGFRDLALVPLYLVYQFPLSLLLAIPGVLALWRRDRGALLGLGLFYAGNVALPLLIRLHDRFQFFLPSYLPIALLIGVGAAARQPGPPRLKPQEGRVIFSAAAFGTRVARLGAVLAAPLAVYAVAAIAGGTLAARLAPARTLPGRDPAVFYLWPPKTNYYGARRYGEAALASMAPRAAIVADWLPYQTLRYLQEVEGKRPDVLLVNINAGGGAQLRFLLAQQEQRPVYLADASPYPYYEIQDIEQCFTATREDVVLRLRWRGETAAPCRAAEA